MCSSKASAKIASGGRIGNALGTQSLEKVDIVAASFDVLQTIAATESVAGDVEDVVGFGIRAMILEQVQAAIDSLEQADIASKLVQERNAAAANALHSGGYFVDDIAPGEHGPGLVGNAGSVQASLDFPLAGSKLPA